MTVKTLDAVDSAIDPKEFFAKYVQTRIPVVIKGLIRDEGFKASRWVRASPYTHLGYLSKRAGHTTVQVEPIHPGSKQFGTDAKRVEMKFSEFLDGLKQEDGEQRYLTTQYSADSEGLHDDGEKEGGVTVYPPPTNALRDDFPIAPKITGKLVLQQHHDFHDNLYCLLAGHKRFVLFPPTQASNLYPHGKIDNIHPNGLISYKHNVVRSDGLEAREAMRFRIKALGEKIAATKGKREKKLEALLEEAIDAEMDFLVEDGGDDDFDEIELDGEDGDEEFPEDEDSDDGQEDTGSAANSRSRGKGKAKVTGKEDDEDDEPSSFSRIPTSALHQHLSLPTTAVSIDSDPSTGFDLSKVSTPFVVDIDPGEMLYLPASWWHEVTSSSPDNSKSNVHMAFNYWFYPPDGLKTFDEPYQDDIVWGYLRGRANGMANGVEKAPELSLSKRKRDADRSSKKAKKAKY
ncbi:Clavaminate synthase-like protein [Thelephora ganbajun]|uniref:Clavaminate synthase-like protein n=1 Tax=Thelephora ganbajun TaxID=370292 RepID=A0ACB6ZR65_THEGA|nr:Clavaminate synthase-like protein [Thelephora ganbajun]